MRKKSDPWQVKSYLVPRGDWHRRLHSPWRILIQDIETGHVGQSDPSPYLEAAVRSVIDGGIPSRGNRVVIVDDDGWIAFGCSTDPEFVSKHGHDCWMGCEIGFAMVEATGRIDPITLSLYEGYAREISDKEDWWKSS